MGAKICSLCQENRELRASHVIPKFVGKWLKDTSGTGYMTSSAKPEERVQDFPTLPLLCSDCEERFSKLETYFANEIFFPFHQKGIRSFECDGWLESLVASLSWRTLKVAYDGMKQNEPKLVSFVDKAELDWRNFLLGKAGTGPYQNHIFFLNPKVEGQNPPKFEWYALRAADSDLAGSQERVFAFTKFPWMIFVSSIIPTILQGWEGTMVKEKGKISTPQTIQDPEFWDFVASRAAFIEGAPSQPLNEGTQKRILKAMAKDPQRFLESDSFATMVLERDRLRMQKMSLMPESVRELVNVITNATEDTAKIKLANRLDVLRSRTIADAISNLVSDESLELNRRILSVIKESGEHDRDALITMETKHLWAIFMVNPHLTRNEQRSRVEAELNKQKARRGSEEIPIVVFSMKTDEDGVNLETGVCV